MSRVGGILLCWGLSAGCLMDRASAQSPANTAVSDCARADAAALPTSAAARYTEPWRPQYHYSPPQAWMNDPNGLVYAGGEYHLFYQYHPYSTVWGPMHWGHAVSRDLLHWQPLPIALCPDQHGAIFSGSVVVDTANTSHLGSRTQPAMVALFTYHDPAREQAATDVESQGLAFSLDAGRTWTKYAANPVLTDPKVRDFRDPKVFWDQPRKHWLMTLAVGDHVAFYSSPDLKHWRHDGDFGQNWGAHTGVWECPDLIQLPIEGESASRYVLLVSVGKGGPNGGSATQYFTGDFDGKRFTPDIPVQGAAPAETPRWLDYGTDDYAGSTWNGGAEGDQRTLFLGWMSNWQYAKQVPTESWRSAMTLPRELRLVRTSVGLVLTARPAAELISLRQTSMPIAAQSVRQRLVLRSAVASDQAAASTRGLIELALDLDMLDADELVLTFANQKGEATDFRIDRAQHRYVLDRTRSGKVDFSPDFASELSAPLPAVPQRTPRATRSAFSWIDHRLRFSSTMGKRYSQHWCFPAFPTIRSRSQPAAPCG